MLDGINKFLYMQLIYDRKPTRIMPSVDFPSSFFWVSQNYHKILVPDLKLQRKELNLAKKFPALSILDVLRGEMTLEVTLLLAEENILFVKVANNMVHLLQPFHLSVNGWIKKWMCQRVADWYAEQIQGDLELGSELESIKKKVTLTAMKPLHARWLIELFNIITTNQGKNVIISGWY